MIQANVSGIETELAQVGFVPEPNGRGTMGLIHGCLSTILLCTWSALHLNLPADGDGFFICTLRKTKWMVLGVLAPEFIGSMAIRELVEARWILKTLRAYNAKVSSPISLQKFLT